MPRDAKKMMAVATMPKKTPYHTAAKPGQQVELNMRANPKLHTQNRKNMYTVTVVGVMLMHARLGGMYESAVC